MTSHLYELVAPDGTVLAWLQPRAAYCDRGRWQLGIEVPIWRSLDDPSPRYYFSLEAAQSETVAYLRAKAVDVKRAAWRTR